MMTKAYLIELLTRRCGVLHPGPIVTIDGVTGILSAVGRADSSGQNFTVTLILDDGQKRDVLVHTLD